MAGVGMADMHQRIEETAQQLVQIARFELHAEQLIKRLCFGLANLVVRVVQREDHAEMKLLAHPLQVRVLVGEQLAQQGREQAVVFLQGLHDAAGRKIQLGQAPAVIFHLLDELERRLAAGENAGGRAGCDGRQRHADFRVELVRLELVALQLGEEAPVECFRVRQ